jgi:hypothetical protein
MRGALPHASYTPSRQGVQTSGHAFSVTCYRDINLFSSQHWESFVVCELWTKEQNIKKEWMNEWMDLKWLQCEMGANDKLYSHPSAFLMLRHDLLSMHSPAMFVPRFLLLGRTMGTHTSSCFRKYTVTLKTTICIISECIPKESCYSFMADIVSSEHESYYINLRNIGSL